MAAIVSESISLLFSSDPASGSRATNAVGSAFDVTLSDAGVLAVPKEAVRCNVSVTRASIYNSSPNITDFATSGNNANNELDLQISGNLVKIVFQNGLYGVSELNSTLQLQLGAFGYPGYAEFVADEAAGKVYLVSKNAALQWMDVVTDPAAANFAILMGWTPAVYTFTAVNTFNPATVTVAKLNNINSFIINSNICRGIAVSGKYNQGALCQVAITAPPSSQIHYQPASPDLIPANELIGAKMSRITFALTDEGGNQIVMPEYWSLMLRITYDLPFALKNPK